MVKPSTTTASWGPKAKSPAGNRTQPSPTLLPVDAGPTRDRHPTFDSPGLVLNQPLELGQGAGLLLLLAQLLGCLPLLDIEGEDFLVGHLGVSPELVVGLIQQVAQHKRRDQRWGETADVEESPHLGLRGELTTEVDQQIQDSRVDRQAERREVFGRLGPKLAKQVDNLGQLLAAHLEGDHGAP